MTDRAVSDVVGFVLVFALVVSTVGIVTSVGFSSLDQQQQAEQLNNVERAFDVFQNNVENVYRDGAPSRATEMRLGGGTLGYGDRVNVTVRKASNHSVNHTIESTPLVYSHHGTDIVYSSGAVIRDDGGGSAMLTEPPFLLDRRRTVIPLVRTTSSLGPEAIARSGTVRIQSRLSSPPATWTAMDIQNADAIEIKVDSPRGDAWGRYLKANGGTEINETGAVEYRFSTEVVSVPRFRIQIDYTE